MVRSTFEEFLAIYNEIDSYMRRKSGSDKYVEHSILINIMTQKERVFYDFSDQLRTMAQLRNLLVHNPFMNDAHPLAEPNIKVIEKYRKIRDQLLNPPKAVSIAIPGQKIYTATLDDNAAKVIKKMATNVFTHVPIVDKGVMIGVFSENSLLSYYAHNPEIILTKNATIREFCDYIPFDKHDSEMFRFLPRNALLADVYNIFNESINKHVRLGALFITQDGKPSQRLLGLITPWDIANQEEWGNTPPKA